MSGTPDQAPWLRHYGAVPAHLEYPECTLYRMVAESAGRMPAAIAWDFREASEEHTKDHEGGGGPFHPVRGRKWLARMP